MKAYTEPFPIHTLKIKIKICQRLSKEVNAYKKESTKNRERLDMMKKEGFDEHDIKMQGRIAAETDMMVPDSISRYKTYVEQLISYIDTAREELQKESIDVEGNEDYKKTFEEAKEIAEGLNAFDD